MLELLSANGPLKKSQPITRQVRFDCLQNLEIWLLFQGLAATHNAICEWWVEFLIAVQFLKNLRQKFQPSSCNKTINAKIRNFESRDRSFRRFSKLNEFLATWNLLSSLAIVQKKNLAPTSYGSSWTLSANFRENSAKIRKKSRFCCFFACFKLLLLCSPSISYIELSTVKNLSSSAF